MHTVGEKKKTRREREEKRDRVPLPADLDTNDRNSQCSRILQGKAKWNRKRQSDLMTLRVNDPNPTER